MCVLRCDRSLCLSEEVVPQNLRTGKDGRRIVGFIDEQRIGCGILRTPFLFSTQFQNTSLPEPPGPKRQATRCRRGPTGKPWRRHLRGRSHGLRRRRVDRGAKRANGERACFFFLSHSFFLQFFSLASYYCKSCSFNPVGLSVL